MFNFGDQFPADFTYPRQIRRLYHEIICTEMNRLVGHPGIPGGEGAQHQDSGTVSYFLKFPEEFQPVHLRHLNIEAYYIGLERMNLFKCVYTIGCSSHHVDGRVLCQYIPDDRSHEYGIIDNKDFYHGAQDARTLLTSSNTFGAWNGLIIY